jgi:Tat protein translocase TatB subunit
MDILGIGFPELVFIFIIALMVFGPRRLPEIAGKAGKFVRDLRNMSQGFLTEWQREITVAARLEELQQVRQELEQTKQTLTQTRTELTASANQIGQTISAVKSLPKAEPIAPPAPQPAETLPPPVEAAAATPLLPDNSTEVATAKNGSSTAAVSTTASPTETSE